MNRAGAYETLQLAENAHPVLVTQAFRVLAAMYHPDNVQSGDRDEFERVVEAYRLLSDPVRRAANNRERDASDISVRPQDDGGSQPVTERRLRTHILTTLYNTRRTAFEKPGLSLWVLVQTTDSSVEAVRFSLWYLRGKKLIEIDHDDCIAITVAGADVVEENDGFMADLSYGSQPVLPPPTF
jgi:curved DNA-binding protein CbpA